MSELADPYVLGRTDAETRRLILQHQIYGPITRRFLQAAGIGTGMKVLDIGSGAGDVALLLADLVGPRGRVVGAELNPAILETARGRVAAAGWSNVTFIAGNVREAPLDADFDAVVGRWVLMHVPDPVATVRQVATLVRVGGIVAFHENDFTYPPDVLPPSDLSRQVQRWSVPPPGTPGPDMRMGTKLFKTYLDAGLPAPQLMVEAPAGGGPDWPGYTYLVETLRSLLPALQRATGLDPREVEIDGLADRLREDVVRRNAIQMLPLMYGAWSRKIDGVT
jgi:ubiquinone/menaquinone biosynthesis C-methylase UbiE